MRYEELLHRCFRCGWCKLPTNFIEINCPSYLKFRFESYSPGGRLWLVRAWRNGDIEAGERLEEIVFSCATCKNCVEACGIPEIKNYLVDMIIGAREEMVNAGKLPRSIRNYLTEINMRGNPFQKLQSERSDWAEGLEVPLYNGHEYLFYVGDVGSFDESAIPMTRAVASMLKDSGISFGILGENEKSDGNDVQALGEQELARHLAKSNIEQFKKSGIRRIITLSPHAFNVMKNAYPTLGGAFEIYHYTQILHSIIKHTKPEGSFDARVTYHDPCYLGRWNGLYREPRAVLQSIAGLRLVEMNRNMNNALCCGGGGGNYFTDMLGSGRDSSARHRVREAREQGADVIAVACPICKKMLEDALKDEDMDSEVRVMDVAQIVLEARRTVA
ncbi:MAG: (Fe-S)-binding protein [Deltaproteobacteria bacterium]|nr:(Fe-S)-binding protein [Deltaproteobacteria bacterium]